MPPQIALFLSLALSAVALRLDFKESRNVSKALWIPLIWVALSASKPISYWLNPNIVWSPDYDHLEGMALERIFLSIMISIGLIILFRRRRHLSQFFIKNRMLTFFFVYLLISVSWSDYQGASFKAWIRMIGDVIMIMIILTEESQEEALWRILRRTAIVFMPLSIVFIKYFRHIGLEYDSTGRVMFTGVTMHKNQLGILCAFVGIFLIWLILKKWPKPDYIDVGLLGGTVFLLFQSRSATSIVVFVIGILVFSLGMRWKSNPRKFSRVLVGFLLLVIVLQGLLLSMVGSSLVPLFFSATARDSSFTGRVPLWQDLIQIGSNKPILGFGFGGFWLGDLTHDLWSRHRWRPVSGHNGYIDVYLELGLVGLLLLSLLIIHTYKKTITSVIESHGKNILFMTYLIMILLHNFTESTIAQANGFLWLLFLVLTVNLENTDSLAETGLDSNISLPNSTGSELNPGQ